MSGRPSMSIMNFVTESESVNDENWMTSYIDVFVLMTSIFVVLFMMNKPDIQPISKSALVTQQVIEPIDVSAKPLPRLPVQTKQQSMSWSETIQQTIQDNALNSHISFSQNNDYSALEIRSQVLFSSGEAQLSRSGEALLEKLVPVLLATDGIIYIEGHTDDQPMQSETFASNWELASARATEVLQFFVVEGVPTDQLRAVSYGDTKPLVPNDTDANRQQNRRVSILLQSPMVTKP